MKIRILFVVALISLLSVACSNDADTSSDISSVVESNMEESSTVSSVAESTEESSTESSVVESTEESSEESSEKSEIVDANVLEFKNARGEVVLTAADLESATVGYYMNEQGESELAVTLVFNENGTEKFAEVTKEAAKNQTAIGIYVDGVLISNPTVSAEYSETGITDGEAIISGSFGSYEQAEELANLINSAIEK